MFELSEPEAVRAFENLPAAPAFASINRDYSFYGTFENKSADVETLVMQAKIDPNLYCRVDAMRMLSDIERKKLLLDRSSEIDPLWLGLYGEILSDNSVSPALKAFFLRIDEQPMDRAYSAWFPELVRAREQFMLAVNSLYCRELQAHFDSLDTYGLWSAKTLLDGLEHRQLKNILLEIITVKDTTQSHVVILDHFRRATAANDKVSALAALNRSSAPERLEILEEVYSQWHTNIIGVCELPPYNCERNARGRVRTNRKGTRQADFPGNSADMVPRPLPDHGEQ